MSQKGKHCMINRTKQDNVARSIMLNRKECFTMPCDLTSTNFGGLEFEKTLPMLIYLLNLRSLWFQYFRIQHPIHEIAV